MGPKKVSHGDAKGKRLISMETKRQIIAKVEQGMKIADVARQYNLPRTTVSTVWHHRSKTLEATVLPTMSHAVSTKQRPQALNEMEKLLMIWINEKQCAGDSIDQNIICEKAKDIYATLTKDDASKAPFLASSGWFMRFKQRHGVHSVVRHGEAASADKPAADAFCEEFSDFIEAEGYVSSQDFNCDETGLFWKKMPKRTFITADETSLPGHKPMKDRFTLLLCANASGDFKVKPLLVYHSENPRAFKRYNVDKDTLPVMWRSNPKAWVTRPLFIEWVRKVFAPTVKKYLEEKGLPLKCVLVLDNATAHPQDLGTELEAEFGWITVKFLPPNTTSLIQPMDQYVIANFKKLYTKHMFRKCFEITNSTNLTLKEFWKTCYNIYQAIQLVDKAWSEVSRRTLNSAWRKILPSAVSERDFVGFEAEHTREEAEVVREIIDVCDELRLKVNEEDVEELVQSHREELSVEDLQQLQDENDRAARGEIIRAGSEEEPDEDEKAITTEQLKDILSKWRDVEEGISRFHPNKPQGYSLITSINESIMPFFSNLLKNRKKQVTLDRYFKRQTSDEPQPGPSGIKKRRREKTPPQELPSVIMAEDSPSLLGKQLPHSPEADEPANVSGHSSSSN